MTLIEGVGDEVTVFVSLLVVLLVLCLAWLSTSVPDLGGIRVIILDHTNFHRLGEIARRYQIIGYQIISGHVVQHNNNQGEAAALQGDPGDQAEGSGDSQSGEEGSEHSGSGDDTGRDQSGDDDQPSESSSTAAEPDNSNRPEPEQTAPSQSEATVSSSLEGDNQSQATDTTQSASALERKTEEKDSLSSVPVDLDNEQLSSSAIQAESCDANELRRRRLAFYEKSDVSPGSSTTLDDQGVHSVSDFQGSFDTVGPSIGTSVNIPEDGTSVDGARTEVEGCDNRTGSAPEVVLPPEGSMRVKIKYIDDRQKQVDAKPTETIGEFKRKHFAGELAENMLVRFIYNGRELRHEASTLQACDIKDGSVIHCLLTRVQREESPRPRAEDEDFNIGVLMLPLFGVILALVWYCRVNYRQFFNGWATFGLSGVTLLFIVFVAARFYVDQREQQPN